MHSLSAKSATRYRICRNARFASPCSLSHTYGRFEPGWEATGAIPEQPTELASTRRDTPKAQLPVVY
jgi:hypothetical protein